MRTAAAASGAFQELPRKSKTAFYYRIKHQSFIINTTFNILNIKAQIKVIFKIKTDFRADCSESETGLNQEKMKEKLVFISFIVCSVSSAVYS